MLFAGPLTYLPAHPEVSKDERGPGGSLGVLCLHAGMRGWLASNGISSPPTHGSIPHHERRRDERRRDGVRGMGNWLHAPPAQHGGRNLQVAATAGPCDSGLLTLGGSACHSVRRAAVISSRSSSYLPAHPEVSKDERGPGGSLGVLRLHARMGRWLSLHRSHGQPRSSHCGASTRHLSRLHFSASPGQADLRGTGSVSRRRIRLRAPHQGVVTEEEACPRKRRLGGSAKAGSRVTDLIAADSWFDTSP